MIYQDNNYVIIKVPNFNDKIPLTKGRRAKYFKSNQTAPLPKKYQDKSKYKWSTKGILVDLKNLPVIKNNLSVGKPKYWKVNGQDFYSGILQFFTRSKVTGIIHEYLKTYLKGIVPIVLKEDERLEISCIISDTLAQKPWDCSNKWVWIKWFEDTAVQLGKIAEDNYFVVQKSGAIQYNQVDTEQERELNFIIKKVKFKKEKDIIFALYGIDHSKFTGNP